MRTRTQLDQEPVYLLVAIERGRNLSDGSHTPAPYAIVEHGGMYWMCLCGVVQCDVVLCDVKCGLDWCGAVWHDELASVRT